MTTRYVPLTEISRPKQWKTLSQSELSKSGFPVYGANGKIGYYKEYNHEEPTLLIGCRGSCGCINISEAQSWINGNAMCLDNLTPEVELRYLYHFLKCYDFSKIISGTSQPQITFKGLTKVSVPLPPVDYQKRITTTLDGICELKENAETRLAKLDVLAKSLFVEMFGDPVENPKGWRVSALKDAAAIKSGSTLPAAIENEGGPVLYCKVADLNLPGNEKWITTSSRAVSFQTAGNGVFPVGTVIFPKNGGAVGTNKKRLSVRPTCVDLNTMGVSPDSAKLESEFLFQWFQFVDLATLAVGTTVPQISAKNMGAKQIYLPPLALQRAFVKKVERIDKVKVSLRETIKQLDTLYRAKLQEYFG